MVGSAIVRTLLAQGVSQDHILTRTHAELDLCNQAAVQAFFAAERPSQVYLAAAKVGGIHANNTYPADFIYDNLMVQANVIHAAHTFGVQKLLFLGSSCIYPRLAPQPMGESASAHRCARTHQRALCRGQDCRHQTVRKLQPPVRA
jgi:GDP-L-fucose synthase